mmetsp:Transcript_24960/g.39157  ORF Transcript_24960/g.39157 Transcript_24960/m.39157 type:complete len:131 (+) Transcript_24960:564-956(+)
MCMQAVTIRPGQDANTVVDQHIRSGCKKEGPKTKKNACSHPGCKEKEFIPVSCKLCKLPFCLKHRFERDHECAVLKAKGSQTAPKPAAKPVPKQAPAQPPRPDTSKDEALARQLAAQEQQRGRGGGTRQG